MADLTDEQIRTLISQHNLGHLNMTGLRNLVRAALAAQQPSREERMVVLDRNAEGVPTIWCDPEIADIVAALNTHGLKTDASCSGHGHVAGLVSLADGREVLIAKDAAQRDLMMSVFPTDINGTPRQQPSQGAEPVLYAVIGPDGKIADNGETLCVACDRTSVADDCFYLNDEQDAGEFRVAEFRVAPQPLRQALEPLTEDEATRALRFGPSSKTMADAVIRVFCDKHGLELRAPAAQGGGHG